MMGDVTYRLPLVMHGRRASVQPQGNGDASDEVAHERVDIDLSLTVLAQPVNPLAPFMRLSLADAIEAVGSSRTYDEDASGIEHFVHRVFSEIDGAQARSIAAAHAVRLAFIERMDAFYLNYEAGDLAPAELRVLASVESALNRIYRVLEILGFGTQPVSASPSEEACSIYDQAAFAHITALVEDALACTGSKNQWAMLGSVACEPGGRWDVLTRLATLGEQLGLIVRLEYRVKFEPASHEVRISFVAPDKDSMPASYFDAEQGLWCTLFDEGRAAQAREYAARMTLVLAAVGFASGAHVRRCVVTEVSLEREVLRTFAIDRSSFMATLAPLAAGLEGCPLCSASADEALRAFAVDEVVTPPQPHICLAPRGDTRCFDVRLRELLLADTVAELEVMEREGDPYMQRIETLRHTEAQDPARAERGYLAIVDELDAWCATRELLCDTPVITRFCESYVGRIILPVLEERRSVRVLRMPDALFFARLRLCRMYLAAEAHERALPVARDLLDSAPTSMQAHTTLVNVLAGLERFEEEIEVARHGLQITYERETCSYLLYRTAFAYWMMGDRETAAACYRLVLHGDMIRELAKKEMDKLLEEMGRSEPPSLEEALAHLKAKGLAYAPWNEGFGQIVDAAVLLTDAGFDFLAFRCVQAMQHILGRDELGVVGMALLG